MRGAAGIEADHLRHGGGDRAESETDAPELHEYVRMCRPILEPLKNRHESARLPVSAFHTLSRPLRRRAVTAAESPAGPAPRDLEMRG